MPDPYNKARTTTVLSGQGLVQLKAFVAAILAFEEQIDAINEKKRQLYIEVRTCGFDKGILRKVIERHKKNKELVAKQDQLVDIYEQAIKGLDYINDKYCPLDN